MGGQEAKTNRRGFTFAKGVANREQAHRRRGHLESVERRRRNDRGAGSREVYPSLERDVMVNVVGIQSVSERARAGGVGGFFSSNARLEH